MALRAPYGAPPELVHLTFMCSLKEALGSTEVTVGATHL